MIVEEDEGVGEAVLVFESSVRVVVMVAKVIIGTIAGVWSGCWFSVGPDEILEAVWS